MHSPGIKPERRRNLQKRKRAKMEPACTKTVSATHISSKKQNKSHQRTAAADIDRDVPYTISDYLAFGLRATMLRNIQNLEPIPPGVREANYKAQTPHG